MRGIYTADGRLLPRTGNDDHGESFDAQLRFTPTSAGDFYIAAAGYGSTVGDYVVRVGLDAIRDVAEGRQGPGRVVLNPIIGDLDKLVTPDDLIAPLERH